VGSEAIFKGMREMKFEELIINNNIRRKDLDLIDIEKSKIFGQKLSNPQKEKARK